MAKKVNTNTPLDERPEADWGRKPYLVGKPEGDASYREFLHGAAAGGTYRSMMARAKYLYATPDQLEHSQFKKPYMGDEFLEMEDFADDFQYLGYNPWDLTIDGDVPPGEEAGTGGGGGGSCSIVCNIHLNSYEWSDDCSELILYFSGEYTATKPWNNVEVVGASHSTAFVENISRWDGKKQKFVAQAGNETYRGVFNQNIQAFCPGSSVDCTAIIDADPDCCYLAADPANSDEVVTLAADPTIATVTVIGGDGSYGWSVTGTGVSMTAATTLVPTNTVECDLATSCGIATVTVTSCGQSVVWTIRIDGNGSAWVEIASTPCDPGVSSGCPVTSNNVLGVYSGGFLFFAGIAGGYYMEEKWSRSAVVGCVLPPSSIAYNRSYSAFTDLPVGLEPEILSFGASHTDCPCGDTFLVPSTNTAVCTGSNLTWWLSSVRLWQWQC